MAGLLVASTASGCVTGHAFQAARRWERVRTYREAQLVGDRLVVGYTAVVTDDEGRRLGERARWAEMSLDDLRAAPADDPVAVRWLAEAPDEASRGEPVAVCAEATPPEPADAGAQCLLAGPVLHVLEGDGADAGFVLDDGGTTYPPVRSTALVHVGRAPWVYPVAPFALAVDAVLVPGLLLLAPAWIAVGD